MARVPEDIRWPPTNDITFDQVFDRLVAIKQRNFPEHTARDLADPYIQILALVAALGQHAIGRANLALLSLSPKTAQSRRAYNSMLEVVNRPLLPAVPARGKVYARFKSAPSVGTVAAQASQRLARAGVTDPNYSTDAAVTVPDTLVPRVELTVSGVKTTESLPLTIVPGGGDSLTFSVETLAFDAVTLAFGAPATAGASVAWEVRNADVGTPDSVADMGSTLEFTVTGYAPNGGGQVRVMHKPSMVAETVDITSPSSGVFKATTSHLGQLSPSLSPQDYELLLEWRVVPNVNDGTAAISANGKASFSIADVLNRDAEWIPSSEGRFEVRLRFVEMVNDNPVTLNSATLTGNFYAVVGAAQGYPQQASIGQTDGTAFQFMPLQLEPMVEPVLNPAVVVVVGGDAAWEVVPDLSDADPTSKVVTLREDPDDGWGVLFGDGAIGVVPDAGSSVVVTLRTGSIQPGDSDPTALRTIGGLNLLDTWTAYRGFTGYQPKEVADLQAALRFRQQVLPGLALRADSVVSVPEITQALSGGAPNRATFIADDGTKPFSRAFYTLEGAGDRQYRVVVVGPESSPDGTVGAGYTQQAEVWLNGTTVGVQVVAGHGPNNTQGIVSVFSAKRLTPTITITIPTVAGVREAADLVVRSFFKPHARDSSTQEFRWEMGGKVPIPVLFGLLWAAIPGRTFITITVSDGTTTYQVGDSVILGTLELPALGLDYDPQTNITVVSG